MTGYENILAGVKFVVAELKSGKGDGFVQLCADLFINEKLYYMCFYLTMTMTKFILKFKTSLRYIRDTSMYKYNNNYSKNK